MPDTYGFTEETGHTADKIEHFDYDAIDTEQDRVKELQAMGHSLSKIICMMVASRLAKERVNTMCWMLMMIQDKKGTDKLLMVDELAFACGFGLVNGDTLEAIGKRYGVSKQAVQNQVRRLQEQFQLHFRTERKQSARDKMSKSNFRQSKTK